MKITLIKHLYISINRITKLFIIRIERTDQYRKITFNSFLIAINKIRLLTHWVKVRTLPQGKRNLIINKLV